MRGFLLGTLEGATGHPVGDGRQLWRSLQVPSDAAPAAPDGNGMLGGGQGQCVAPADQRTPEVKAEAEGPGGSGCTQAKLVELERSNTRPPAGTLLIVRDMHNPTM